MSTNWLLAALLVGCGDAITAKNAGEGGDSGVDADDDSSDTDGGPAGEQAYCEAAPARELTLSATASDPQGNDSLSTTSTVSV